MRLGVLSRRASLYSTSRLVEAAKQRGHEVQVVDYLRCYMDITSSKPAVLLLGNRLQFDAVIPRIGATYTQYGTAVVRQFQLMGVFPTNEADAIARARDKLRALQLLTQAGVGLPTTSYAHSTKDINGLIDVVGGTPLVVKLLEGTQGVGVVLAETLSAARSVIAAFRQLDADILVQRYIKEAKGADIRAFVVGRKTVAAMERRAAPGEFRANIHQGASAAATKLTPEERKTAIAAARAVGLSVCGVDFLRTPDGPLVLEVNSSPGLEGIEKASGIDVASEVIRWIERQLATRDARGRTK